MHEAIARAKALDDGTRAALAVAEISPNIELAVKAFRVFAPSDTRVTVTRQQHSGGEASVEGFDPVNGYALFHRGIVV